jgi:hypothetical protein
VLNQIRHCNSLQDFCNRPNRDLPNSHLKSHFEGSILAFRFNAMRKGFRCQLLLFTLGVVTNRTRVLLLFALVLLLLCSREAMSETPQPPLACEYVPEGKDVKRLNGSFLRRVGDGRLTLHGSLDLVTSKAWNAVKWVACTAPDGKLLWAARTQEEAGKIGDTILDTDGDFIWTGYLLKSGALRLAKFEGKTLRKQASLQIAFEPTTLPSPYVFLLSQDHPEVDLQIAAVQPVGDSLRVGLFSRDLHVIFDKLYGIATPLLDKASQTVPEPYLAPLPDKSGYYLCAWRRPGGDTKAAPAASIVRLDNNGTVKWANTYSLGDSTFQRGPRVAEDGALLLGVNRTDARPHKTLLAKVGPDGAVNWATTIDGVNGGPADLHVHGDPYRFTSPNLLSSVCSMQWTGFTRSYSPSTTRRGRLKSS